MLASAPAANRLSATSRRNAVLRSGRLLGRQRRGEARLRAPGDGGFRHHREGAAGRSCRAFVLHGIPSTFRHRPARSDNAVTRRPSAHERECHGKLRRRENVLRLEVVRPSRRSEAGLNSRDVPSDIVATDAQYRLTEESEPWHHVDAARARRKKIQPLIVRITHWVNAVAMVIMIGSGWRIFNDSPLFPYIFPLKSRSAAMCSFPSRSGRTAAWAGRCNGISPACGCWC